MTGANPEYSHLYDEIDSLKAINADLLAALESIAEWTDAREMSRYQIARAAIAKAQP